MDQIKIKEQELQKNPLDSKISHQIKPLQQQVKVLTLNEIETKLKYAKQKF